MKRGECELTREQLLLAYRQLKRPDWPHTLEEAMADSVRAGCIKGMARCLSRAKFGGGQQRTAPRTLPGAPPVPPTPTHLPKPRGKAQDGGPRLRPMSQRFDAKRAAANDRDDD